MAKERISPTCKYHNIPLQIATRNGKTASYVALAIEPSNNSLQLNYGYTFHVYECPRCSYIELHDLGA